MTINQKGLIMQPGKGSSYWFGVDLLTFKAVGEDTQQQYVLLETIVQPGSGVVPHIHSREDESFYIQEGTFEFYLDGQKSLATPGTFLYSPKGQLHSFINIGSEPGKLLVWVTPAGFEKFMAEVATPAENQIAPAQPLNADDLQRIIQVAQKYGMEIIPPQVN